MKNRLLYGGFTAASLSFSLYIIIYLIVMQIDNDFLCFNFLPPALMSACEQMGNDMRQTIVGIAASSMILTFVCAAAWLVWLHMSPEVETPDDVVGKRPAWIWLLSAGMTVTGGGSYWAAVGFKEATNLWSSGSTIFGTAIFLVAFILVTVFATPFMLRSAVPTGTTLGGWLRFP